MSDKYKIDLEIATEAAEKSLRDLRKSLQGFDKASDNAVESTDDISTGLKRSSGAMDSFKGNLAADFVAGAFQQMASAAAGLFRLFIVDGVKAAQVQEDAVNAVATAMQTAGDFTQDALQDFQDFASGIQQNSKYGDEVVLQNLAMAKSFGASNEQAKALVEASVELAAAQGKSLDEAVRQVSKTLGGFAGELGEVNPKIKELTAEQLKNGEAARVLIEQYGGSAAGAIRTYSGALEQAKNRFGDFLETVGATITQNDAVIATMNAVGEAFGKASDGVTGNTDAFKTLVAEGLILVIKTFGDMVQAIDNVNRMIDVFVAGFLQQFAEARLAGLKFLNVFKDQRDQIQQTEAVVKSYADSVNEAFNGESTLENFTREIRSVQSAAEEALAGMKDGTTTTAEAYENVKTKIREVASEQQALKDQSAAFGQGLLDAAKNMEQKYSMEMEMLQAQKEQELLTEEEFQNSRLALLEQKKAEELAMLETWRQSNQVSEEQYSAASVQLQKQQDLEKLKSQLELKKQEDKIEEEKKKQDEANQKAALQGTASLFGALSALSATAGKKQFKVTKALSTAQAITQGILAIQQAWASAPAPFNAPAIAAATIATGLNVHRIQSQRPPSFATGGIVGGTSYFGDRVAANVNSGEMILNRNQQRNMFDMINSGETGGGSKIDRAISLLTQVVNQPISIQIDGREIVNVTRAQLESGRTLA